jgi:succinylglutamic semialdehyde dehydrogenase
MHFINNTWVKTGSHAFTSLNPATGAVLWEGQAAGEKEVAAAVDAAHKAFPAWAALPYEARYKICDKF